jgi:hypothetical protein
LSKAEEIVREYLAAMERRDLAAAKAMLAPGFFMVFPGDRRFDSLEALVQWARGRYRSAKKTYQRFDAATPTSVSSTVSLCATASSSISRCGTTSPK